MTSIKKMKTLIYKTIIEIIDLLRQLRSADLERQIAGLKSINKQLADRIEYAEFCKKRELEQRDASRNRELNNDTGY